MEEAAVDFLAFKNSFQAIEVLLRRNCGRRVLITSSSHSFLCLLCCCCSCCCSCCCCPHFLLCEAFQRKKKKLKNPFRSILLSIFCLRQDYILPSVSRSVFGHRRRCNNTRKLCFLVCVFRCSSTWGERALWRVRTPRYKCSSTRREKIAYGKPISSYSRILELGGSCFLASSFFVERGNVKTDHDGNKIYNSGTNLISFWNGNKKMGNRTQSCLVTPTNMFVQFSLFEERTTQQVRKKKFSPHFLMHSKWTTSLFMRKEKKGKKQGKWEPLPSFSDQSQTNTIQFFFR